jgi:hypothetical protein
MISAIPALATALFIAFFGTNVPFWDEWDLAELLEKLAHHAATLADFVQPQSEHRFVIPKLILAPLALHTHWNVTAELWLSFAVAVAGYIGLLILMRGADGGRIFVTALAYFSLAACENWLWGWQFSWFLANTFFIWAVVAADSIRNRFLQVAAAVVFCVLSTFSAAYGIASWLALAPFLWLPVKEDETTVRRVAAFAVWAAFFSASLGFYVYRYDVTPGGSSCGEVSCWIRYVLAVAGSPLTRTNTLSIAVGGILLASFTIVGLRAWVNRERPALPWIPIGLFAIGFAIINAIGRSGLGLGQALSSRYLTPASFLLIAAINLDWRPHRFRHALRVGVAAALIVQSLTSIPFGWQIKHARDESRVCLELLLLNDSSDCTAPLAASNATLRRRAIAMHQIGLRPLVAPSDFQATPEVRGSIDIVGRFPTVRVRGRVELPAHGLYVVAATAEAERRIVAADLIRGAGSAEVLLNLPPHVTRRQSAFEVWLFVPTDRKLYRLSRVFSAR